ncbi:MerR family transcriptional regulator [Alteromonas gracilis]
MASKHVQIGEVADRTGLSLRTIRYYEEVGLITPTDRTTGGFRLYSEDDIARLRLIMRMKPLDFSLEEMRDVLGILDGFAQTDTPTDPADVRRLDDYRETVLERIQTLQARLASAQEFAAELRAEIEGHDPAGGPR